MREVLCLGKEVVVRTGRLGWSELVYLGKYVDGMS